MALDTLTADHRRRPSGRSGWLQRLVRWLPGSQGSAPAGSIRGPHAVPQMWAVLQRERARADRNGHVFCLLTFRCTEPDADGSGLRVLLRLLENRLRMTDEIGWLDEQCLAAVLPYTPTSGAWKVADDIVAQYPTESWPPRCEVYCYPSDRSRLTQPDGGELQWQGPRDRSARPLELLFVQPLPWWKRLLDLAGAATALLLLAPLLAAVALAIRCESPGPVIFRQQRSGRGGRPFTIYKFRTMVADASHRKQELLDANEQDGPAFKMKHDPRVTPLGSLLRVTSIDELPQLWNVLRGDMSLVGPRPLPCEESRACSPWHLRRLDVTPGLTGVWQVQGRSTVCFDRWMRMDLRYIETRSVKQDVKLLVLTVPAVLLRKGAH